MSDIFEHYLSSFREEQNTLPHQGRFPHFLRAVVVETADPLNMGRIRFKCPEFHDDNIALNNCPWAVPAPMTGGPNAGDWANPCVGDIIFICFEKDHPYAPVFVSAADPTKRRQYTLESVHTETPVYLDDRGNPSDSDDVPNPPDDYDKNYLPNDRRPMSKGFKDRYGNSIIMNSVGYFPNTHFSQDNSNNPVANSPDMKYISFMSKYGNMFILNDIGYEWKEEFSGDAEKDSRFEIDRYKYVQKLVSENASSKVDQRRIELRTRAGHKFEMRDTGWNKSRSKEYTDNTTSVKLANNSLDQRWIKLVSKGGHLFQLIDKGFDSENDVRYNTKLLDDVGSTHNEDDWDDARQVRIITRYGFKFVLDDRGSSQTDASKETPRGNGFLVKGRRSKSGSDRETTSGSSSNERGYGIEFNEKDDINALKAYSPNSKLLEINDKYGFVLLCTDLPFDISMPYKGTKDNEFSLSSGRQNQAAEKQTYHLILDKENKYTRLKTPLLQGIESRDNEQWTEVRDPGDRGMWINNISKTAIFRSGEANTAFVMLDDVGNSVLLQNQNGKIQLYCSGPIEIISDDDINMKAQNINLRAKTAINMTAAGVSAKLAGGALGCSGDIKCDNMYGYIPEAERPTITSGFGIAKRTPVASTTPNPKPDIKNRSDLSPKQDTEERGFAAEFPTAPVSEDVVKG